MSQHCKKPPWGEIQAAHDNAMFLGTFALMQVGRLVGNEPELLLILPKAWELACLRSAGNRQQNHPSRSCQQERVIRIYRCFAADRRQVSAYALRAEAAFMPEP
jgi:hypothetical protein